MQGGGSKEINEKGKVGCSLHVSIDVGRKKSCKNKKEIFTDVDLKRKLKP